MDENYLDQLLKEVEKQNIVTPEPEEDVASEMQDFISQKDLEMEQTLSEDAEHIQDVAWSDSEISTDEISELDQLDELADLDMESLDFEDIDFDDIDITKMDINPTSLQQEFEHLEDMNIDETYLDESDDQAFEQEIQQMKTDDEDVQKDLDVDSLLEEVFSTPSDEMSDAGTLDAQSMNDMLNAMADASATGDDNNSATGSDDNSSDMDDLFAMLGIEGGSAISQPIPESDEIPDFEIPPELADVPDINDEKKKKKGFMDLLFGDDEDDMLSPEQEAELAKQKEEKLQAKLAKKEQQKEKKAAADAKKAASKKEKSAQATAKKAARKAADEKALAEDGPEKKLNKPLSVIIILFFLIVGAVIIIGTNIFDYTLVITKATNYFERQKYGMAYREIVGVVVKEQDQELEDKIYTVMYVERQYEAYENYVKMNRPDMALDALIQGLGKYDSYYNDAVELGIEEDLNTARDKIVTALDATFHLNPEDAYGLLQLESGDYTNRIRQITGNMSFLPDEE